MINELYPLSKAMERAGITAQGWHRKYKPVPNVSAKAPCFRIVLDKGRIYEISTLDKELAARLRKFGSNQGTFNACNLAPLYRVTDEEVKKKLRELQSGKLDSFDQAQLRAWCVSGNWGKKFRGKYAISMKAVPAELKDLLSGDNAYAPMRTLLEEAAPFADAQTLYDALERAVFSLLEQRVDVATALQLLFHPGNAEKPAEDDTGALSVVFDSRELIEAGIPAASERFTREVNAALLSADSGAQGDRIADAFGLPFVPLTDPMPTVKLAGGFEVTLRTMFGDEPSQSRYGRAGSDAYPVSPGLRLELQAALGWLSDAEHKNQTWMNTDKDEILFVYPHTLPGTNAQFVRAFKRPPDGAAFFEKEAASLVADLRGLHGEGAQAHAERLSVFILRRIDRGRCKVLYDRVTDPDELKARADAWTQGCRNLPGFPFGQPRTPFPVDVADTLNRVWKQDGTHAADRFRPVPPYRGLELLLEKDEPVTQELALLAGSCICLTPYLGRLSTRDREHSSLIWQNVKEMAALCGLMLNRLSVRREDYMADYPYQYGQLLKISDEIHVLYCMVMRKGEVPPQLAGSGLVQAATEAPVRTLSQLGQRMQPYLTWAGSYRRQGITEPGKESWRAGWLMRLYEPLAEQLSRKLTVMTRLSDAEKAQLFLGCLAALPRVDKAENPARETTEAIDTHETEENRHE